MVDDGVFLYNGSRENTISTYVNKFSFLTHPTKDVAILRGKRTANNQTRQLVYLNPPGDLYVANIDVYDDNTRVAYYSYDINTGKAVRSNGKNITKGRTYTVKVQIGNAKNRKILATKNQATVGITKRVFIFKFIYIKFKELIEC